MRCTRSESTEIPRCEPITSLGWLGYLFPKWLGSEFLPCWRTDIPTLYSTYVRLQDPVQWETVRESISTWFYPHKPLPKFWLSYPPVYRGTISYFHTYFFFFLRSDPSSIYQNWYRTISYFCTISIYQEEGISYYHTITSGKTVPIPTHICIPGQRLYCNYLLVGTVQACQQDSR